MPFDSFKTSVSSKNDVRLKTISSTLLSTQPSQLRTFPSSQKHVTILVCVGWTQVNPGRQMILSTRQVQAKLWLPEAPSFAPLATAVPRAGEQDGGNSRGLFAQSQLPGGFQGRPRGKSGWTFRGVYGGMLRKLSILVKSETGISDPFGRKRTWLSVALGHINAHMQSGCLRIKPSIKQGIIHGLWGWQTFTLGHRGLDLLSVTGEWMTGVGVTKEVTRGAPGLWSVFKSIKPTQVQADGWIGQYKKPQRDSSLILLIKLCGQGPGVPSRKLHSTFSGNYEFHFGTEQNCLNIPLAEARITGYQCWVC